jgi:hypothetical protein
MTNGAERQAQDGGLCVQAIAGRCVRQRPASSDRNQGLATKTIQVGEASKITSALSNIYRDSAT